MASYDRRQRRSSNVSPLLVSLLIQIVSQLGKLPYKPPVTIGLLALNIIVHIHPNPYFLDYSLANARQNCIHPGVIVSSLLNDQSLLLNRLVLAGFMHADDTHLYYNMLSLLWKGVNLEQHLGSTHFLGLVVFSLLVSHCLLVLLSALLFAFTSDVSLSGYNSCAIGLSAVLFSLKYVWNYHSPSYTSVMGFMVPGKWAAWAELVAISLLSPQASFLGHLAGILAGYLYVHGGSIVKSRNFHGGGQVGGEGVRATAPSQTEDNHTYKAYEIELEDLDDLSSGSTSLSAEELRYRRLNRYTAAKRR